MAAAEKTRGHALALPADGVRLGIDHSTVARAWREYGVAPDGKAPSRSPPTRNWWPRLSTLCGYTGPRLQNAVLLCVEEKSQIQSVEHTFPGLPMQPRDAGSPHPRLTSPRDLPCALRWKPPPATSPPRPDRGTGAKTYCPSSSKSPGPT